MADAIKKQGINRKICHKVNKLLIQPVTGERKRTLNLAAFGKRVRSEARAVCKCLRARIEIYS